MSKTDAIDPSVPAGSRDPKLGDDDIREFKRATIELFDVDHYVGADGGSGYDEDQAGQHTQVTGRAQASVSIPAAGTGLLWFKTVSGIVELMYTDKNGNEKQLTSGGKINIAATDIANNLIDSQHYAAGSIDNEHLADNAVDSDEIADGAIDLVHLSAALKHTPTSYKNEKSVTLPNGLIIKMGKTASISKDSDGTVSFDTAFSTGIKSVVVTQEGTKNTTSMGNITVSSVATTGFTIENGGDTAGAFYWLAIGY